MSAPTPPPIDPGTVEDDTLWCMQISGMDEVHPAPDRATAQLWAASWTADWHRRNPVPRLHDPVMNFTVAQWPWDAASHADKLAKSIADNTWPLAALDRAPADVGVRAEDMVLVPREPTMAMVERANDEIMDFLDEYDFRRIWSAMIAAAPGSEGGS